MAKITTVDYEAIPAHAKQMRAEGQSINTEISNAYTKIANMHNVWYGKRYNELVKSFNNMVSGINELLEIVVKEIPFSLETVANNYAQADKGSKITQAENTTPKKINPISLSNDVGMKFLTSEVTTIKSEVSSNFKNAKTKMDTFEGHFNKVKWESEAATAFKTRFSKLKNKISNEFTEIESQFSSLMQQTLEDIQSTENANTVK